MLATNAIGSTRMNHAMGELNVSPIELQTDAAMAMPMPMAATMITAPVIEIGSRRLRAWAARLIAARSASV